MNKLFHHIQVQQWPFSNLKIHQWSSSSFFDSSQIDSHYNYIIYITLHIYIAFVHCSTSDLVDRIGRQRYENGCHLVAGYFCLKELISFYKASKIHFFFFGSFPIEYLSLCQKQQKDRDAIWNEISSQGGQLNQHLSYWSFCLLNSTLLVYCFIVILVWGCCHAQFTAPWNIYIWILNYVPFLLWLSLLHAFRLIIKIFYSFFFFLTLKYLWQFCWFPNVKASF